MSDYDRIARMVQRLQHSKSIEEAPKDGIPSLDTLKDGKLGFRYLSEWGYRIVTKYKGKLFYSQKFRETFSPSYGEIYAYSVNDTITISGTGESNKVQVTSFATDGLSYNMNPDHNQDHIGVNEAGIYLCTASIGAASGAGAAFRAGFGVYKNNGGTAFENCHCHRNLAGGGGDFGSMSISGIIKLAEGDTVELWVWNETNTTNIIVDDVTLSLVQIF